jgi:hypothetical protein
MLGSAVLIMVVFGISVLTIGIFLGILVVLGMWLTIEQIPGVRALGRTNVGMLILSIGAAYLVHMLIGGTTIVGMIAAASALVIKYFLLQAEANTDQIEDGMGRNAQIIVMSPHSVGA